MGKITIYVDDDELADELDPEGETSLNDIITKLEVLGASNIEYDEGETIKADCSDPDSIGQTLLSEFGTCVRMTEPW